MNQPNPIYNYLTIDVEDYFQVSGFEQQVGSHEQWSRFEVRVENNTRRILDLLDQYGVKATFFVLGWVAENFPALVREIAERGHILGCHSYYHRLVYDLTPEEFRRDTGQAKEILEQTAGCAVQGYRAPSYSITRRSLWALEILEELGFEYDSSIFPIYHDRYGIPDAPRFEYTVPGRRLKEYPISTSIFLGRKVPVAGGGYFRLFPYWFTRMALRKINSQEGKPFVFYLHPWEVDPGQPRMENVSMLSRFRHYNNLDKTGQRLERLLNDFHFQPMGGS